MQSATSFFNPSLFRGSLRRSWPLWFAYTLAWLMILPLSLLVELSDGYRLDRVDVAQGFLSRGVVGGVAMAVICGIFFAMTMFAYLTNPRATQGFHAMPVRREGLYLTSYLTGLFCLLSSILAAFALAGVTTAAFGKPAFAELCTGLLAAVLAVLFFYSFAVFCMMFTGQILAAPVFYGILNVLAVGMEFLVRTFAGNFLFGFSDNFNNIFLAPLSPIYQIATSVSVSRVRETQLVDGVMMGIPTDNWEVQGMGVLAAYAAVGLVFALLGLLVYRRRASEASGSTVAIPWARPLFKYGVALCAAFSLGQLVYYLFFGIDLSQGEYSLAGTIACMLFAGLLGYFAAEMLLQKSFRVWRSGRAGALVFSAVLMCFGFGMSLDLTGYESYIPDLDEVQAVRVNMSAYGTDIYETLSEPESIALAADAHRALIADKKRQLANVNTPKDAENGIGYLSYRIYYYLEDGSTVERRYYSCTVFADELNDPDSLTSKLTALAGCPEVARKRTLGSDFDRAEHIFTGGYVYLYANETLDSVARDDSAELTAAQTRTLYDALERDYALGHASDASLFIGNRREGAYSFTLELWYTEKADRAQAGEITEYTAIAYEGKAYFTVADKGSYALCLEVAPTMTCTLEAIVSMGLFEDISLSALS